MSSTGESFSSRIEYQRKLNDSRARKKAFSEFHEARRSETLFAVHLEK
jgi:hypothetical protein